MSKPLIVSAVSWNDAHFNTDEVDESEITHRPWVYITTGIVVRSDAVGVTFSNDVGEDGKFRGRNFVPREMIIDQWEIGPLKKKPKRRKATQLAEANQVAPKDPQQS